MRRFIHMGYIRRRAPFGHHTTEGDDCGCDASLFLFIQCLPPQKAQPGTSVLAHYQQPEVRRSMHASAFAEYTLHSLFWAFQLAEKSEQREFGLLASLGPLVFYRCSIQWHYLNDIANMGQPSFILMIEWRAGQSTHLHTVRGESTECWRVNQ